MKRLPWFAVAGVMLALTGMVTAEDVHVVDVRQSTADEGYSVTFVSQRTAPGDPMGVAMMAVGRGAAADAIDYEFAYGMTIENGEPRLSEIPVDRVRALRGATEGEPVRTFIVEVDVAQYAKALEHLTHCAANTEDPDLTPAALLHEAARIMVLSLPGLKEPYRGGGRRSPDMQTYFEDLSVLNRNK